MNDDNGVPDSVGDVVAKAARMGRAAQAESGSPGPDLAGLQASLSAVASRARLQGSAGPRAVTAAASDAAGRAPSAPPAVTETDAANASAVDRVAPTAAQAAASTAAGPAFGGAATAPFSTKADAQAAGAFAAPFARTSEVIAALQDKSDVQDIGGASTNAVGRLQPVAGPLLATLQPGVTTPVVAPSAAVPAPPAAALPTEAASRPTAGLAAAWLQQLAHLRQVCSARTQAGLAVAKGQVVALPRWTWAAVPSALLLATVGGIAVQTGTGPGAAGLARRDAMAVPASAGMQPSADDKQRALSAQTAAIASSVAAEIDTAVIVPADAATAATEIRAGAATVLAGAARQAPPRGLGIVAERGDAGNTALAEQLLGAVHAGNGDAGAASEVGADHWAAGLAALATQPRVAVVRYDALQAARQAPVSARIPALQIVAPLSLEPLYVVVRADSPLQFVHELQGRAINAGPAQSSRALSADTLHRALFGQPLPAHPLRAQDEAAALDSVAAGKLDAVVLVGSAARPWFANLLGAAGGQFKLLSFDARQPLAQRVVGAGGSFLLTHAEPRSLGAFPAARTPTLSLMSFVVTAGGDASASESGGESVGLQARAIAGLAAELCRLRPTAQTAASASRQRVDPGLQLDVGLPYSAAAQAVFNRCGAAGSASAGSPGVAPPAS